MHLSEYLSENLKANNYTTLIRVDTKIRVLEIKW